MDEPSLDKSWIGDGRGGEERGRKGRKDKCEREGSVGEEGSGRKR